MKLPSSSRSDPLQRRRPIPRDVKRAIELMRKSICHPISMTDLVQHCGVAERTLNKHFRAFLGVSPMRYLQRLRLAAAREILLAGFPGISVTDVAKRFQFNHFGRFSGQYRNCFGEAPSATLRNAQNVLRTVTHADTAQRNRPPLPSREKPSIAIVPCQVSANEPNLLWLAESVAESLVAALSSVRSLAVMAPKSFRATRLEPQRQARELHARYVLTGRVVPAGARLRFILRIFDSSTGYHVWGDSFDGERDQPLELQERIIAGVFNAIPHRIRGAEIDRARRAPPQNLDAYGLAMRALPFVFASRPEAARRALELLHRAIEIDPDYALATALAAWGHGQLVMYNGTTTPAEERTRALELVQRAAILDDDDDPMALAARCAVHTMAGEFDVAEALVSRSVALDPSSGWAWGRSAWLHAYKGDSDAAIDQFGRALALDSSNASRVNSFTGIGAAHFNAGRYEAAAFWLQSSLIAEPTTAWPNRSLSVSYARMGEQLKARASMTALRRFCPDLTVGQVVAAVPFRPEFLNRLGDGLTGLGLPP